MGEWKEGAIFLRKIDNATVVMVERNGVWVEVIRNYGETISHIVETNGINSALQDSRKHEKIFKR